MTIRYPHGNINAKTRNTSWVKIFDFVNENSNVLDIGCSDGKLGHELIVKKKCRVVGTEIHRPDYEKAKRVLDKAYLLNIETESLPRSLKNIKFDAIIFADVLEHLVDPVGSLKKIKQLLAINGKVIFSIPNMAHISVRLQLLGGDFNYNETGLLDKTHYHFYNQAEVERIFAEAGYQITILDNNTLTYPPSFLQKKLQNLKLADNGFIKQVSKDMQAQAFQYVGCAMLPKKGSSIKPVKLIASTPEKELTYYIESLKDHISKLEVVLNDKQLELDQANYTLDRILFSKSWKLTQAITKLAHRIMQFIGINKNG